MIARLAVLVLLGLVLLLPGLADENRDEAADFGGDPGGGSPLGQSDPQPPAGETGAGGETAPPPPAGEREPSGDEFSPTEQLRHDQEVDYPVDI